MTSFVASSDNAHKLHAPAYAELQAITNFSFLEGGSHPDELVKQAKELGLAALAVADRNTLAGVVRAHSAAKAAGLRLIIGARLVLEDAPDLLCFPTDRPAYGRLCRLLSHGQMKADKGKCILRLGDVIDHAEGQIFIVIPSSDWDWRDVIVPTDAQLIPFPGGSRFAAQSSSFSSTKSRRTFADHLRDLKSSLPSQSLFLAASHGYCGADRARIAALARLAETVHVPFVATGDVLFHNPQRRRLQDVLTCIRNGVTITDAGLRLQKNAERHLKSPAEMARLFKGYESALARTVEIVERCHFSLDQLSRDYPDEPVPAGKTAQSYLEELAYQGAHERFPDGIPDSVTQSLKDELALIARLEYAPYFLTVYDIVAFARRNGILAQGRGSAANSVICYCLHITGVNPVEVDLLFERFISPERLEPPDIDVDFEHERREEVIQHIYTTYGRHRAGLAATVISYRARSAIREVGKALGLTEDTISALAGMVWGIRSKGELPAKRVREAGLDPSDPLLMTALELAEELIGFPRHLSQHVGGFVLTRGPLIENVPVGNAAMPNRTFIEWDKDDLAAVGLLKVDVLGLGMLTCIRKAFDLLSLHHAKDLQTRYGTKTMTLADVPRKDSAVYEMLCKADAIGVFQVESRAQMNMLPRLKPREFYDLVIEVAIVRPGPIQGNMVHPYLRRRNGEPVVFPSPDPKYGDTNELEKILGKTLGVPLFQEQAMRIAQTAAGFSSAEVNELRQAMATFRRRGTIGLLEEKMISSMVRRGYERDFAERCFNQIKGFGEYGFPESHAASFAHLVYVSAWIKYHYPAVFACALLNSQPMGFYAPAQIVRDAREHDVEVRPVDIHFSNWDSTLEASDIAEKPALRLGFRQVDGMSEKEAEALVALRTQLTQGGVIPSQQKNPLVFCNAHDLRKHAAVKLATLERLAAADCFRSMGWDRRQALWEIKGLGPAAPAALFASNATCDIGSEPETILPAMPLSEHVVNDYQTLKLSLKAHPMHFLRTGLANEKILSCADLMDPAKARNGARVAIAGVILVRQMPGSAKGVVFMTIEDETGIANIIVWPKTFERYRRVVMGARMVVVHGAIQRQDDIIHVVSRALIDRTDDLATLVEDHQTVLQVPIARADEVLRPTPGSARSSDHPHWSKPERPAHPRNLRIIPKSRDFH